MRISDWSSDVCSSDLHTVVAATRCGYQRGDTELRETYRSRLRGTTHDSSCPRTSRRPLRIGGILKRAAIVRSALGQANLDCGAGLTTSGHRKRQRLNSSNQCATPQPSSACNKKLQHILLHIQT